MRYLAIALVLSLLLATGCDDATDDDPGQESAPWGFDLMASDDTRYVPPCTSRVAAMFDPRPMTSNLPYPSDLFTEADPGTPTGLRVALDRQNTPLVDELMIDNGWLGFSINETDGFGVSSHVFLPLFNDDGGVVGLPSIEDSSAPDSPILLIELAPDKQSAEGQVEFLAVHRPYMDQIEIAPPKPLKSATTYLVVLTDAVADADGVGICPTWQFYAVRSRYAVDGDPATRPMEVLRQEWSSYFDLLAGDPWNLPRERIVQLTPFTTSSVEHDLQSIREQLIEIAEFVPPVISDLQISDGGGRPHVGAVVRGKIETPVWQDEDSGTFVLDPETHRPEQQGSELIPFVLTIPKPGEAGGQPYPVVVSMHGINASKETLLSFSDQFAADGFAVIGIDHPFHGERGDPDQVSMWSAGKLLALGDALRMRDNLRQGIAENLQLIRALQYSMDDMDVSPVGGDGQPDLDTGSLFLFGHSLGALMNSTLYTVEPEFTAAAGTAGGGGWTNEVYSSPYMEIAVEIFELLGMDFTWPPDSFRLFILWYQCLLDPGDSNSYARFLRLDPLSGFGQRPYLMMEAVDDPTVPNAVTHEWCRFGGIPLIDPYIEPVEGLEVVSVPAENWGLFQYPTDNHDFFYGGDYKTYARKQVLHFYGSALETGTAEIIDPMEESAP